MQHNTTTPELTPQDYQYYWEKGTDYAAYYKNAETLAETGTTEGYGQYIPMNFHRMQRIAKTFELGEAVKNALAALQHTVYWLVITEPWCGDASQIVPVLHAVAAASEGKIVLKLIPRDQYLTLMDAHATQGSHSIPKLIQMDENFKVNNTWGPRPSSAQALVLELKELGTKFELLSTTLHKWYADDKQQEIQTEICELLTM